MLTVLINNDTRRGAYVLNSITSVRGGMEWNRRLSETDDILKGEISITFSPIKAFGEQLNSKL